MNTQKDNDECTDMNAVMHAHIDGELSSVLTQQVDEHLQGCTECDKHYGELINLTQAMKSSEIRDSAPAHLYQQVSTQLKRAEAKRSYWFGIPPALTYSLPALVLGLVTGWATLSYLNTQQEQDVYLAAMTSAHIRSLMADHLTDIASSDSHTVEPWFHGRLDFSPPVYDLTGDGYPLIGGRLEYLMNTSTAALVYRHRQHTINLFISPGHEPTVDMQSVEYKGYNMIGWNKGSFFYWVVSDLNVIDLEHFKVLINRRVLTESG
jgi:anti-sigma factor RsiW